MAQVKGMMVIDHPGNLKVLEDFFHDLAYSDQRKIFTAGFKKAAKPLIAMAKMKVPEKTGNLRKSIGSVMVQGDIAIIVGARTTGSNKGFHGHLVEFGTRQRTHKSGKSVGRMPGAYFFKESMDRTEGKVFDTIAEEFYDSIDRFIIRTNKRLK